MGISFRRKIFRGKNGSGLNLSWSGRNGFGYSITTKPIGKNVTFNLKPGRKMRTTLSIPGTGIRWTSSSAKSKSTTEKVYKEKRPTKAEERRIEAYNEMQQEEFAKAYTDTAWNLNCIRDKILKHDALIKTINNNIANFKEIDWNDSKGIANLFEKIAELDEEINILIQEREEYLLDLFELRESNSLWFSVCTGAEEYNGLDMPANKFRELRSNIISVDKDIDKRRRIHYPEEYLTDVLIRRKNYVTQMKNLVEDNAVIDKVRAPNSFLYIFKPRSIAEVFVLSGFIGFAYIFANRILMHFS